MAKKYMQVWWLILLSISSSVAGQTVIKLGVSRPGASDAASSILSLVALIVKSPLILLGLILYGAGALAWISVLTRLELSYAYPFLALNFVLVALVSRVALGESIPTLRWLGIAVICVGILLVARSSLE
jgi:drug/metabolite transporter (DMT)-like permease